MRRPSRLAALRRPSPLAALLAMVVTVGFAASSVASRRPVAPTVVPAATDLLGSLPLAFEAAAPDRFTSRGPGFSVALTPADAHVAVGGGSFRMRPAGPAANLAARLAGRGLLPGTVTRFHGDDPASWSAATSTYGEVVAREVWPGVDMVWHGNQRRLQHDVVVAPGVDPAVVALAFEGARSLAIGAGGDLVIDLGGATTRLARPVLYQDAPAGRRSVTGGFALLGPATVGFSVGDYDRELPLVIDPTLVTSTFLGGGGADSGYGVARDREGHIYVVGATESSDFPTGAPFQGRLIPAASGGSTTDVFVAKLRPDGTGLVWSTYLGGQGRDTGYGVAVGPDGGVYVAGVTESNDFPRARSAQDNYGGGPSDAFVAKIASNGTALEWSTFLGGTQSDRARGIAVDPNGNAYVTGSTSSVDFPTVSAQQSGAYRPDDVDAFVAKIPSMGAPLAYSTRLGGSNDDHGLAIAVDGQGSAFVTGDTLSPGFPTVRPFQAGSGGSASGVAGSFPDAFVAKYSPTGSALVYSTFLGGSDFDQGTAIAVDATGAAYVTGNTNSPNFPTAGPVQGRKDGDVDAFVAKLDPPGGALMYSTYVGGAGADGGNGIAVDATGSAVVVGTTGSSNWPASRAVQGAKGGGSDAFVLKLNAPGNVPLFSSFVGGRDEDQGMGVALGADGMVHVLGLTSSVDFPTARPFQGTRGAGGTDAFLSSLSLADARAPVSVAPAGVAADTGHDRRVRALGILTLALLAAAVAQTFYLRRRPPAPRPEPAAAASTAPARTGGGAGLTVLGDDPQVTVVAAAGSTTAGPAKSPRTPKARGGPKGRPKPGAPAADAVKSGGPGTGAITFPAASPIGRAPASGDDADDGGEPTIAVPAPVGPEPPPLHEPAIARLLEEDIWRPDPAPPKPVPPGTWERLADDRSGEVEAVPPDAVPAPATAASAGPPAIPPLPAEDLSFWDLFPEDLPPARAGGLQVDEIVANEAPPQPVDDRFAGAPAGPSATPGQPIEAELGPDRPLWPEAPPAPWPGPPPEAEIVIAELLDGPAAAGPKATSEPERAPERPDGDFLISDLLSDELGAPDTPAGRPSDDHDGDEGHDRPRPDGHGISADEQARIAADRARRRRSRRSGRRKRPSSGSPG